MSSLGCLLKGYGRITNCVPLCWRWLNPVEIRRGSFFLSVWGAWSAVVDQLGFTFAPLFSQCFAEVWSVLPPQKAHRSEALGLLGAEHEASWLIAVLLEKPFCGDHSSHVSCNWVRRTNAGPGCSEHVGSLLMPCSSNLGNKFSIF